MFMLGEHISGTSQHLPVNPWSHEHAEKNELRVQWSDGLPQQMLFHHPSSRPCSIVRTGAPRMSAGIEASIEMLRSIVMSGSEECAMAAKRAGVQG